jgi:hypothetical protein
LTTLGGTFQEHELASEVDLKPIYADMETKLAQLTAAKQTPEVQRAIESLRAAQQQVAGACPLSMLIQLP